MNRALSGLTALLAVFATPALAKDGTDAWLEISARAVHSDRNVVESDDIDSSGVGASVQSGFEWRKGRTSVQFDLGASTFKFEDDTRNTRNSANASVTVTQKLSETVSVAVSAGHSENIPTLEAFETDQSAIRLEVKYENKQDRLRLRAHYRERHYEDVAGQTGDGMRYDLQYNHRFASWHWARIDLAYDQIGSDAARRGYDRYSARATYSLPIAPRLRLMPEVDYRNWRYDNRRVLDDPALARRKDHYVAPEIGLAYGKDEGLSARVRGAWQFRHSNDPRYRDDAPYLEASLSYRF